MEPSIKEETLHKICTGRIGFVRRAGNGVSFDLSHCCAKLVSAWKVYAQKIYV